MSETGQPSRLDELLALSRFERAMTWLHRRVLRRGGYWVTPRNGRRIQAELDRLYAQAARAGELEAEIQHLQAQHLAFVAERLAWHGAGLLDDDLVSDTLAAVAAVVVDDFLATVAD